MPIKKRGRHRNQPAREGGIVMTSQEAIRVLMLSPIYFKLKPVNRKQLIQEYCNLFARVCKQQHDSKKNRSH